MDSLLVLYSLVIFAAIVALVYYEVIDVRRSRQKEAHA
jgi:hypothetical protein